MKQSIMYLISALVVLGQFSHAQAAEVEVKWSNSDKYSDIDAGEEHRKHFKERTFKSFEKHFADLAATLPEQQKLIVDITDVDLAGDVNFSGIKRIRVVKSIYFPRIDFSYQLLNADNKVIKGKEVSLKDLGFLSHTGLRYRNKTLSYEKEMLDDWFRETFADDVIK